MDDTGDEDAGFRSGPRYLTSDVAGVDGELRTSEDDFVVEELPSREPEGTGDHVWFQVEKRGLATMAAVHDVARELDVHPGDVGVAGLKDARAVTRQWLSVEHVEPERVLELDIPRIRVLRAVRARRKLRTGQLAGNRFLVRIRDVDAAREPDVRRVLDVLEGRGVPNDFGVQRFGARGDTGAIGEAIVAGDFEGAAALVAGSPGPTDAGSALRARELYDDGRYEEAVPLWPRAYRAARRICVVRARGRDARQAVLALDASIRRFYVSAYQSELFNAVLSARIDTLDRLLPGEVAWEHGATRPAFRVPDPAPFAARVRGLEVSPTGPLVGARADVPTGEAGSVEAGALRSAGWPPGGDAAAALASPALRRMGARRPLRVPVRDLSARWIRSQKTDVLELTFTLPPGSYATSLLDEIGKGRLRGMGGVDDTAPAQHVVGK